jgi:hypothetical protein
MPRSPAIAGRPKAGTGSGSPSRLFSTLLTCRQCLCLLKRLRLTFSRPSCLKGVLELSWCNLASAWPLHGLRVLFLRKLYRTTKRLSGAWENESLTSKTESETLMSRCTISGWNSGKNGLHSLALPYSLLDKSEAWSVRQTFRTGQTWLRMPPVCPQSVIFKRNWFNLRNEPELSKHWLAGPKVS